MHFGVITGLLAAMAAQPGIVWAAAPATIAPTGPSAASPGLAARIAALPALLAGTAGYDDAFAPEFRDAVPPAEWRALLARMAAGAGRALDVAGVEVTSPWSASVQVRFERALIGLRIRVEPAPPHRIAGLQVTGPVAAEASVPAVLAAIRALPGHAGVAVAELGGDAPVPRPGVDNGLAVSIGSEFKLVILAELIRAIAAGERHWDDVVTIGGRPLPGGRYRALAVGAEVPLRVLAQAMVSVSDNSAADLLIATLGRERIEAMLPVLGIEAPAGMRPFLTTLEAFKLKAMIAAGQSGWLGADEAGRRALLAGPVAEFPIERIDGAFAAGRPLSIAAVEWRASPEDMIRVLDWIRRHTEDGAAAEARTILSMNPGPAGAGWRYVGYKGGSEPGVVAMSLLLQRPSGAWLAVSAGWNDAERPVDEGRFGSLVGRLVELLRTGD